MNYVLAEAARASAPENPWPGVDVTWTSPDGATTWALTDRRSPVRLLAGVRGLTMPRLERFADQTPALHGQRFRGWRASPREVFWPISIYGGDRSQQWLDLDAAFWASLRPDEYGTWRVTTPERGFREVRLRLASEDTPWTFSPGLSRWGSYQVYLEADQPFWTSETVSRAFGAGSGARFADPETPELWHISRASTAATAQINNPGDVEAWPIWWLTGATDSAELGLSGQVIEVPFAVAGDKTLIIDSDPSERRAVLITTPAALTDPEATVTERMQTVAAAVGTGVDRTKDLGEVRFAPVPRGQQRDLDITLVGTGSVQVLLTPRHFRAWG